MQVAAMSAGISNLNTSPQGVWSKCQDRTPATGGLKWKPGELQFEALMRMLDNKVQLGSRLHASVFGADSIISSRVTRLATVTKALSCCNL